MSAPSRKKYPFPNQYKEPACVKRAGFFQARSQLPFNEKIPPKQTPRWNFGADEQIRTVDLFLTKEVLCLLSYISV